MNCRTVVVDCCRPTFGAWEKLGALYSDPGLYAVAPFGGFRTRQFDLCGTKQEIYGQVGRPKSQRRTFFEKGGSQTVATRVESLSGSLTASFAVATFAQASGMPDKKHARPKVPF